MELLELVFKEQNYFTFNNQIYQQTDGLAMGSPLSGILAEIYLNHFENNFIFSDNNKTKDKIIFYSRYVDDICLLYSGNARQLKLLLNYLNSITKKLQFTLEVEDNKQLNFLDLTLKKSGNSLKYSIYRKPTKTDQTIHVSSYHSAAHKRSAYNSMIYRLLHVPMSPADFTGELNIIKHIAVSNGYSSKMVENILKIKEVRKLAPLKALMTWKAPSMSPWNMATGYITPCHGN